FPWLLTVVVVASAAKQRGLPRISRSCQSFCASDQARRDGEQLKENPAVGGRRGVGSVLDETAQIVPPTAAYSKAHFVSRAINDYAALTIHFICILLLATPQKSHSASVTLSGQAWENPKLPSSTTLPIPCEGNRGTARSWGMKAKPSVVASRRLCCL